MKEKIKMPITKKLKLKHKRLILLIGILLVILLGLFFLTTNKNNVEKTMETENGELKEHKEEDKKINIVDINSKSRPYAVMINNIGVARPLQSGLQDAYIIYELIVEDI